MSKAMKGFGLVVLNFNDSRGGIHCLPEFFNLQSHAIRSRNRSSAEAEVPLKLSEKFSLIVQLPPRSSTCEKRTVQPFSRRLNRRRWKIERRINNLQFD